LDKLGKQWGGNKKSRFEEKYLFFLNKNKNYLLASKGIDVLNLKAFLNK
jgi:hypothetical protein